MEKGIKRARGTGRERVYNFLVEFITKNGYSPSVREICIGADLRSTSSVCLHLETLKTMGMIDMKENTPRSISLVGYNVLKGEGLA